MNNKGFTLLEVMVALLVFATLAAITSSAMYYAFDTRARVSAQADRLAGLQSALAFLDRDTHQVVERAIRGNELRVFPPFIGQPYYVEFTRGGFVNPLHIEQRSSLKRVAYLCKNNQLIRRTWGALDTPTRNQYQDKLLLDHVTTCTFAYVAHNRQILPDWHPYALQQNQTKETLPTAIQIALSIKEWGNLSLLYILPEALYAE